MDNFDLKKYLAEGKLFEEEKYSGAIIRKGSSDKAKEDTKIVRQALKKAGIKFTNRGEFGMDFKDADLAQIKKVIAGEKVGEFVVSRDVNEGRLKKLKTKKIMDNFDLKKYLAEGRLLKEEIKTPRYPEGKISVEDKVKAIVPLWQQYSQANDLRLQNQIKDKISRYTAYDDEYGGGSYTLEILDDAQSIEDVAKIVMKNEKGNTTSQQQYSVKLLVPTIYYNVENGELSDNKFEWYTDGELKAGADQTSYTSGEELDDVVFSNDYDQALNFAKRYPNLISVN